MASQHMLGLRWGVEQRLEFVETRLFWEGFVNRSDLIDTFGISVQQASTDLNRYLALAPDNMIYDKSAKSYVRRETYAPKFFKPSADQFLAQLRSLAEGTLQPDHVWSMGTTPVEVATTPARGIDVMVLRDIITAVRAKDALEIEYQSMAKPEPLWRWIEPHAIGFDGFRWHVRAYCANDSMFKDFVISRIIAVGERRSASVCAQDDLDWQQTVTLTIGPHPKLTSGQKRIIELDYGMSRGVAEIQVKRAFLYYTLKRLGLDVDPSTRRPQDQQIVLLSMSPPLDGARTDD
ncbi:WYL domain-containing protein [Polymorphum gilvum]|uniref:Predicted transcriptional regulator n=1 Tax=Polymorphum gilvum (strain LMG 25793 / CGMCC 1.9160 / SL003B-26A1) TaxID=991905 RepID=F2J3X1_POLGS|nr:WYL domain-containing protein [Polymorphum gilvum]ADZ68953.1 Predicted transcriptional regulator [Polymorphum gilvum SL003B-26A1]